jgi:glycine dehydrogenase
LRRGELDRLCDALIQIKKEIDKVKSGEYDKVDNPLKNAPHTAAHCLSSDWKHKYTREEAAYPLPWVKSRGKFWPSVGRVDNVHGDRHLTCKFPDASEYFGTLA